VLVRGDKIPSGNYFGHGAPERDVVSQKLTAYAVQSRGGQLRNPGRVGLVMGTECSRPGLLGPMLVTSPSQLTGQWRLNREWWTVTVATCMPGAGPVRAAGLAGGGVRHILRHQEQRITELRRQGVVVRKRA